MRWSIKPQPEEKQIEALAKELGVSSTIAKLLIQRDITTYEEAKNFFRPQITDLHNPFLMRDMQSAVDRILQAIKNEEYILVYGDYDVDGTTSVALMYAYLLTITPNVTTYIPDRYEEGYGVSYQGIDYAHDNNISLVIALDCGIKAIDKVAYAKEKGIDFIICDHHRPGKEIPDAVAVLDPKREDCKYPYKELCGCGVGFKLIQALHQTQEKSITELYPYLDLVATAIAADIVPITGENRILAHYGLKMINEKPRTGLQALLENFKQKEFTITDVVFKIAPRINAAGRIKHGLHAVELLTETNLEQAKIYAQEIETYNQDRRDLDANITQEALVQITENKEEENFSTVVYQENWHKGVIGIVASRLIETYYKPTLVFTKSGEKMAASARSVKGFDVYEALEACSEYIEQFGGHKYAAGLTILSENYVPFREKFEEVVKNTILEHQKIPEITIDAELDFDEITPKFYRILKQFAPFGPGNMHPVFMTENLKDTGFARKVGTEETHLKCQLQQENNQNVFDAIGFGLGEKLSLIENQQKFAIAYSLDENEWNGNVSLQLRLRDIR
ncbi:single-stranded-DNA-specific exonuclease RecJ [Mesonia sp. K7]|uniref:single-stranded-DNA-specific exonuclease RecJ n=1 Tax=Mesonia sp. K7 TaxID=2218606 RepID=UPI000DAA5354|nr:single-stranded-DNA-specific exonuclease RecJ [Mesonia sp. K7]PZD77404.1 single-stranded-DNA-specific exonuclease RecJ [Mesonia sp. K7]